MPWYVCVRQGVTIVIKCHVQLCVRVMCNCVEAKNQHKAACMCCRVFHTHNEQHCSFVCLRPPTWMVQWMGHVWHCGAFRMVVRMRW